MHGLIVRHTEPIYELALLSDLAEPVRYFLSAAVYDDRTEADQLQQSDILDYTFLQFVVDHGAAAVFHNNGRALEMLDIGQCLDQHPRLFQV